MKIFSIFRMIDFRMIYEHGIPILGMIAYRYNCDMKDAISIISKQKIRNIAIYYLLYKYFRYGKYWEFDNSKHHNMEELKKKTWAYKFKFKYEKESNDILEKHNSQGAHR